MKISKTGRAIANYKLDSRFLLPLFLPVMMVLGLFLARPAAAQTPLTWAGLNNGASFDGNWDTNGASPDVNWLFNGVYTNYVDNDVVVFDDTAAGISLGATNVNLTGTVMPTSVTINNTNFIYTIGGSGSIGGQTVLTKNGTNTLFLFSANTFTNNGVGVNLNGGLVVVGAGQSATSGGLGASVTGISTNFINFAGGTLQLTNTYDFSPRILRTGNQTINLNIPNANGVSLAGQILGANTTFNVRGLITNGPNTSTTELLLTCPSNTFTVPVGTSITLSGGQFRCNSPGVSGSQTAFNGNPIVELTPDSQIYFNVAGTYSDPLTIQGQGTLESDGTGATQAGSMRLAAASTILTGTITLAGNTTIGSRGSGITGGYILGKITGPYGIRFNWSSFGGTGGSLGSLNLSNVLNNWTGYTMMGDGFLRTLAAGVIPNGPGFGDVWLTNAGALYNTGISNTYFDLDGFNQTINGLDSVTNGIDPSQPGKLLILNDGSKACTLTIGNNNASGYYAGRIVTSSNALSLTKIGTGTETLTGTNTYTGSTIVNGGTLQLSGSGSIASQTLLVSNATFGMTIAMNLSTLGLTNATLTVPRVSLSPVLTANTVNLGGAANVIQIGSVPPIAVYPAVFPIIHYNTALSGNAATLGVTVPLNYAGFLSNDVSGSQTVYLVLTTGIVTPSISWFGSASGSLNTTWDIGATTDWTNTITHVASTYSDQSIATFDDTGNTNLVNLTANYAPLGLTINNSILNYDFVGSGSIGGTNAVLKEGAATLIWDNASNNTFSGGLVINAGTLQIGNYDTNGAVGTGPVTDNGSLVFARTNSILLPEVVSGSGSISQIGTNSTLILSGANTFAGGVLVSNSSLLQIANSTALGTTNSLTTIASGSSLDINGFSLTASIVASGVGVTNSGATNGAIFSSSASSSGPPSVSSVTLLGDTVFGCPPFVNSFLSNRWDIRGTGAALIANSHNLIKLGANQVSLSGVTVDPTLGNIDIQNGIFSIENATTGLGNPADTLTVEGGGSPGAVLDLLSATVPLNKTFIVNGNGLYNSGLGSLNVSGGGVSVLAGPMTLNNNVNISFVTPAGAATTGSLVLSNAIGGSGSLTKNNTNLLTLAGNNSYSGGTIVNAGTLLLNGINNNAANQLTVNYGENPFTSIVGGSGTNDGEVFINDTIWPGAGGTPSTFSIKNELTFPGGPQANAVFSLGSQTIVGSGVNDLLTVNNFDGEGATVSINLLGPLTTGSQYTLVNYAGTTGSSFGTAQVYPASVPQPNRYALSVSQTGGNGAGHVTLSVTTGAGIMRWTGIADDTSVISNVWDIYNYQTWSNTATASPQEPGDFVFQQGDEVVFDDLIATDGGTNVVVIETNDPDGPGGGSPVLPSAIIFNNSISNYFFTNFNGGSIGGNTTITKNGTASVMIGEANTFSGTVTINAGSIIVDKAGALGSLNNVIVVTNTGALDVGGGGLAANTVTAVGNLVEISGTGPGNGEGCLANTGPFTQEDAFTNILMTGNASIGNNAPINVAGRFDIGRSTTQVNNFSTGGHNYNLTKVGTNQISLVALNVDTNLGNIDIQGGLLGFETTTTGMGNPTNTCTVESGAVLELYQEPNLLNKVIIINGGALAQGTFENLQFNSGSASQNIVVGPVTITNGIVVVGGGGDGTFSNTVSGPSSLTIAGTVYMAATNTYTGNTTISNTGSLFLIGNGSINNSPNIYQQGTIDVSALAGYTLTLNGAINQSLTVTNWNPTNAFTTSTINGSLTNSANCTVSLAPGATNFAILTVKSNATLLGTTALKLSQAAATNDVLNVGGALAYGGTLNLTTVTGSLAAGQTNKLFNASTYSGVFGAIVPATPGAGLIWNTSQLGVNGTISVQSSNPAPPPYTLPPGALKLTLNGLNVTVTGTNGQVGDAYYLLMTTNLTANHWFPVATNVLSSTGALGSFTFNGTNVVTPGAQQQFYMFLNTNAVPASGIP